MANEEIKSYEEFAERYAASVDKKPIHMYYERPSTWSLLPKDLTGLKVLDIGCGSGWYAEQLHQYGAEVFALDRSEKMVAMTTARTKQQCRYRVADLNQPLDFLADHEFDIIVAPQVIHYIDDWPALFTELARVLKVQGQLVLSTHQPHTTHFLWKLDTYYKQRVIEDHWPGENITVQYYHHTLQDLFEAFYHAGFMVQRLLEPFPDDELKAMPEMYGKISKNPWFLFIKAIKIPQELG